MSLISRLAAADQGMLAADLSELLDRAREEYAPNLPELSSVDVLAALPVILAALQAQVDKREATDTGLPARFADAPRAKSHGGVVHTCNGDDVRGLPFGRRDVENCARCWELDNGAEPREDYAAGRRSRHGDAPTAEERATHRRTCRACRTGDVCTAFDW